MPTQHLTSLFEVHVQQRYFSGAGLVKKGDDIIFSGAYGYAHKGFKVPNTIDTMFDTASITKLFTSIAVLQLVDQGLLKLSDEITDIVDLSGTKIPDAVTLYHLLTHTSGIADDVDEEAGEEYADIFRTKPNYAIRETRDLLAQFAEKEPLFTPGEKSRYNNCAFVLLGLAIEKVTGVSYREYVAQNIFVRAGMSNTAFCAMDGVNENTAECYVGIEDEQENIIAWRKNIYLYPPIGSPDGGAFSSVGDLDLFIRAVKDGKLLSPELTAEVMQPRVLATELKDGNRKMYGYGFAFLVAPDCTIISIFKEGINAGVMGMLAYYPALDMTNVVLANQTCDAWILHREVRDVILGD